MGGAEGDEKRGARKGIVTAAAAAFVKEEEDEVEGCVAEAAVDGVSSSDGGCSFGRRQLEVSGVGASSLFAGASSCLRRAAGVDGGCTRDKASVYVMRWCCGSICRVRQELAEQEVDSACSPLLRFSTLVLARV